MAGTADEAREKYLQTIVESASREDLLLMLLDGAVKFMNKAETAFNEEKWDEVHNQLCRVQNIFVELALTLKLETGDFAAQLADIYGFIHGLLVKANVDRDREAFTESKRLINEIRKMWVDTIAKARVEEAPGKERAPIPREAKPSPKSINVTG
jgi:flagellar protein FliS